MHCTIYNGNYVGSRGQVSRPMLSLTIVRSLSNSTIRDPEVRNGWGRESLPDRSASYCTYTASIELVTERPG